MTDTLIPDSPPTPPAAPADAAPGLLSSLPAAVVAPDGATRAAGSVLPLALARLASAALEAADAFAKEA